MVVFLLEELKVSELKKQLLSRGLSALGRKEELRERLVQFLIAEGENPESFEFNIKTLEELMITAQEENRAAQEENRAAQEENRAAQEVNRKGLDRLEKLFLDGQQRLTEVEGRIDSLERLIEAHTDDVRRRVSDLEKQVQSSCRSQGGVQSVEHTKTPTFDGTVSWSVYKAQFEIAARKNNWQTNQQKAENLIFALKGEALQLIEFIVDKEDYDTIVKAFETRFGNQNSPEIFRAQLKNRRQKSEESLQQLEADVERLANLGYPMCPREVLNTIIVDGFITALKNSETRRALRVARVTSPGEALTFAINYEAFEEPSAGPLRVRRVETEEEKEELDERVRRIFDKRPTYKRDNNSPRCWNCDKL